MAADLGRTCSQCNLLLMDWHPTPNICFSSILNLQRRILAGRSTDGLQLTKKELNISVSLRKHKVAKWISFLKAWLKINTFTHIFSTWWILCIGGGRCYVIDDKMVSEVGWCLHHQRGTWAGWATATGPFNRNRGQYAVNGINCKRFKNLHRIWAPVCGVHQQERQCRCNESTHFSQTDSNEILL